MPNLRVVYDNVVNRAALTASSEAGNLVVGNLKNDRKTAVWRTTSKTATLTVVFPEAEIVGCVALPFCNLSATATIRVRGYTNVSDQSPAFNTGPQLACAPAAFGEWDWGALPLGVNAFSYVGGTYGAVWFPLNSVRKLVIDIDDSLSEASYIESARCVIGSYWSPKVNADWGAAIQMVDRSKHERSDASDLRTERGTRSRKINIDLKHMDPSDRAQLWNILGGNGMSYPVFMSLVPESDDPVEEQTYQIYAKLTQQSKVAHQYHRAFQAPLELEEV